MNKKDWDAKHYKKHSEPQEEMAISIIKQIPFRGDEIVLDIGCGDGKITKEITTKVPDGKVIGIDPSANMIEECKKSYADIKNLSFVQAGAENFHLDIPFDLIVSFFALHYVADHLKALKNIFKTLKPDGTFTALMAGGNQPEIEEVFNREPWKTLLSGQEEKWHAKTENEYKLMLKEVGFVNISTKTELASRIIDTKKEIFDWLIAWIPYVTGFEKNKSMEITQEIVETIAKGKKENIKMTFPILYVKAKKPE